MKKLCKNCTYYNASMRETNVLSEFIISNKEVREVHDINWPKEVIRSGFTGFIKMCTHSSCFREKFSYFNPVIGNEYKTVRINGQAILNKNGTCPYYNRKWWKVWVKK